MIKELEKVMIEDVEYSFDPEKEYIKDGHASVSYTHLTLPTSDLV